MKLDKLRMNDSAFILGNNGELICNRQHETHIIGEVIFQDISPLTGEVLFTSSPEYNDIIITGSTMVLEKIFGVRSALGISTLSQDLGVNAATLPNATNLKDESIIGFMVGIGGAGETIGDVKTVTYTDKSIPSMIPFRMSAVELAGADASPYLMKQLVNGKYNYYVKRFSTNPIIRHLFTDGSEVPSNISQTGTSKGIRAFGEVTCEISTSDLREYFISVDGNTDKCRINSLGLVSGYMAGNDIAGVRLITTLNFKSRYLINAEDNIRIIYRLYCL